MDSRPINRTDVLELRLDRMDEQVRDIIGSQRGLITAETLTLMLAPLRQELAEARSDIGEIKDERRAIRHLQLAQALGFVGAVVIAVLAASGVLGG